MKSHAPVEKETKTPAVSTFFESKTIPNDPKVIWKEDPLEEENSATTTVRFSR